MNPTATSTVVLPVYNSEAYLGECIESLLGQTHADFEILAIDDGSRDGSPAMLADYARRDSRLRVLTQPENRGLVEALNLGIRSATTRWIFRQDADDRAHPERLRKCLDYLARNPETSLLGTWVERINTDGRLLGVERFPANDGELRWQFLFRNPFAHSAVVFDRAQAIALGGYVKASRHGEDYDLWTRLAGVGRIANLPEALLAYRVHGDNITAKYGAEMATTSARMAARWFGKITGDAAAEKTWEAFRLRAPLDVGALEDARARLLSLFERSDVFSGYSRNKAAADIAWHFLAFYKHRPELLRDPRGLLGILKRVPSLYPWPAHRWRAT